MYTKAYVHDLCSNFNAIVHQIWYILHRFRASTYQKELCGYYSDRMTYHQC